MKFYKHLFLGDIELDKKKKICTSLRRRKILYDIHVVILGTGTNQLEFFHNAYLRQAYYKKNPPYIVGIAKNKDSAINLIEVITNYVLNETGNVNIKEYILNTMN